MTRTKKQIPNGKIKKAICIVWSLDFGICYLPLGCIIWILGFVSWNFVLVFIWFLDFEFWNFVLVFFWILVLGICLLVFVLVFFWILVLGSWNFVLVFIWFLDFAFWNFYWPSAMVK